MFKNLVKKTLWVTALTLAFLLNGNLTPQAEAASLQFFKFLLDFPSGGSLKGVVTGELQSDNNTVTNLSNLWAVYYADFIPPNSTNPPATSLPPLVFNTLDLNSNPNPQFTLDGNSFLSFAGTNNNGDIFNITNNGTNANAVVINQQSTLIDSYSNASILPFTAENVIYCFLITADLTKDTTTVPGIGFPDQGNVEGYVLFPNNVDSLKQFNPNFSPLVAVDYPFTDFLFVFSDEIDNPRFALIPNGDTGTFTAINPGKVKVKGATNPTNPETFELILHWDVGYNDPNDTNEVLKTNAGSDLFLPIFQGETSRLVFFDDLQNPEAIYQANSGTLNATKDIPEPSNIIALASLLGLAFWQKKNKK